MKYRFVKAAAKAKDPENAATEFGDYSEDSRADCVAWLDERWGISGVAWDAASVARCLAMFRAKSKRFSWLRLACSFRRILRRILQPTGLIVVTGDEDHEACVAKLEQVFGHLYFRRTLEAPGWRPKLFKDLVSTTLIVIPEVPTLWALLLPKECVHRLDPRCGVEVQLGGIAEFLQMRCQSREALEPLRGH
ncbi:MAG: hypothetical protein EAZ71_06855 [Verrucomicrobia bacterium]|nr:MAG: hypothetical protein EAZ82_12470 [Verrucomicrobiota bacterium]TAF25856.1 MAG: hypothetical protein EAZ71_06855 [Verrucomicrobiota bacterium]